MANSLFIETLQGVAHWPPPVWLMRQAGRYMPEYRALRAMAGGFLDLVYNPDFATEVTLQPIRRFDFDAAILFSDILVIPHALGRNLRFEQGEGPRLDPLLTSAEIEALNIENVLPFLEPVFETVRRVRSSLAPDKALIGFCGAPWTLATYMIAGRGKDEQEAAKKFAYSNPELFAALIDTLVEASVIYLVAQLKAGADCVQIFDSWAGALDSMGFEEWVIAPTKKIVDGVRYAYPDAKIIGFPKGCGALLRHYPKATGVDAVGLDWQQDLSDAATWFDIPVQGNLDPLRLFGSNDMTAKIIACMKRTMKGRPYIFNLGHGISKDTPIEAVDHLIQTLRQS